MPEKRLREAYDQLKKKGIPLASNQVNYSLIYRAPEENGVKAACDELGVTLIAYSPIAQGMRPILIFHFLDLFPVYTIFMPKVFHVLKFRKCSIIYFKPCLSQLNLVL